MAKVILICGKLCSGKSTYAHKIRCKNRSIILSVDDIMISLFGQSLGEKHDEYAKRIKDYLFNKSLDLIENGVDVILDWGFWKKEDRENAKDFYRKRNIEAELHYIDVDDEQWRELINRRNNAVSISEIDAYYVDDNLINKFLSLFEIPDKEEIDVSIKY